MFTTIINTITNKDQTPAVYPITDELERQQLIMDVKHWVNGVIFDGSDDAMINDDNVVEGWFETYSGQDVYVEIMYLPETDEFVYTIGNYMTETMPQIVTQDIWVAIDTMRHYAIVGA